MEDKKLNGTTLAGSNPTRGRAKDDYYATPPETTEALLDKVKFEGETFLEPCVGEGHIVNVILEHYPKAKISSMDLVDRGFPGTVVGDFLDVKPKEGHYFDNIITNPPYSLAQQFLEKSMDLVKDGGKIALFLKIQFLEGAKRNKMFKSFPPKYVYVFSKRQNPWRNGSPVDENGKKWSSTMCFAWFIWEKGFRGDPVIKWI